MRLHFTLLKGPRAAITTTLKNSIRQFCPRVSPFMVLAHGTISGGLVREGEEGNSPGAAVHPSNETSVRDVPTGAELRSQGFFAQIKAEITDEDLHLPWALQRISGSLLRGATEVHVPATCRKDGAMVCIKRARDGNVGVTSGWRGWHIPQKR